MSFGLTSSIPRPTRGWPRPRCGRRRRPRPLRHPASSAPTNPAIHHDTSSRTGQISRLRADPSRSHRATQPVRSTRSAPNEVLDAPRATRVMQCGRACTSPAPRRSGAVAGSDQSVPVDELLRRPLSELDAVMNRLPALCRLTALPAHARADTHKLGAGSFDATTWSSLPVGCPPLTDAPIGIPDRLRGHFLASGPAAHARTEYVPDRQWAVVDQRDVGFCWGRHALLGSDGD